MAKISELIDIKTGYANYVNLVDEFSDPDSNRARMRGYMPITSHRVAFERLAHLCLPKDKRAYLLLGTYGTGKRHLLLMLANYLGRKKREVEFDLLRSNWDEVDPDQSAKLQSWRGNGRYLVALVDFGKGGTFEAMVLRAIEEACRRDGYEGYARTHYGEAAAWLRDRREQQAQGGPAGALHDLVARLEQLYPATTRDGLIQGLERYDAETMMQFRQAYRDALGASFQVDGDNLVDILESFLGEEAFRERYRGLVILADEFGYVLDHGDLDVSVFHRFTEMCRAGVGGATLAFIGTGHRVSLQAYAGAGYSEVDIGVLADRIEAVALRSEGIEEIISAIVVPRTESPLWQETVGAHASSIRKLANRCTSAGIFRHLSAPKRRTRIIEAIYPLHPMATHCAIELASIVGSAARSLFTFFAGKPNVLEEGSYPWYVENHDIVTGDKLSLYTVDLLASYFREELQPENLQTRKIVRDEVLNYQASVRLVEEQAAAQSLAEPDPFLMRVLDAVLVLRVVRLAPKMENIAFALDLTTLTEEARLTHALKALREGQALFLNPNTDAYEFRMAGTGRDIQQLIDAFLEDPAGHPKDLAVTVMETEQLKGNDLWLVAEAHNQPYAEDKRLLRTFAVPADIERDDYALELDRELLDVDDWRKRYEGVAVYVLCESKSDVDRARRAVAKSASDRVVYGIPDEPMPIRDNLLHLLAAKHVEQHENLNEWSEQERTRFYQDYVGDRTRGYTGAFVKARNRYLQGRDLVWRGAHGGVLCEHPTLAHEPASALIGQLYPQRNKAASFDLNHAHVKFGAKVNTPLIDAVNALVKTSLPVTIDVNLSANTGDIRYLRSALANYDVLVQQGKASGSLIPYQVQRDTSRYQDSYPALADLLRRLMAMKPRSEVIVSRLLDRYARPPYGLGPNALALFLAVAIRALGDSLQLKWSAEEWGVVMVDTADTVFDLVSGDHPTAVFAYREITPPERASINRLFGLFSEDPGGAGEEHAIGDAYGAIKLWWSNQTNLSKVPDIYPQESKVRGFVAKLAQIDSHTPHDFVLTELQTVFGLEATDAITDTNAQQLLESVASCKAETMRRPEEVKRALIDDLVAPFEPRSSVYGDYKDAIEVWYKGLQEYQKDLHAYLSDQQQVPLMLQFLPKIDSLEDTFWRDLPSSVGFGLGEVDDWTSDRSQEYVHRFRQGLEAIARCKPPVPDPIWEVTGGNASITNRGNDRTVQYSGEVQLSVRVSDKVGQVFLTSDGTDPTLANAQRVKVDDEWTETVTKSPQIRLVSRTADGEYGRVVDLQFRNRDLRYQIQPKPQSRLNEHEYYFVLAHDAHGVKMTFESLIEATLARSDISKMELAALLRALADGLEE